jgi:hypothetical protein
MTPSHVRVLKPERTMRKSAIFLLRPLACVAHLVALSLLLTGCAALDSLLAPPSLKDGAAPNLAISPAAVIPTKAAHVAPARSFAPSRNVGADKDRCVDQGCLARLKALLEDGERKWVGRPQSPLEHADGTRQFAYRALRAKLSCTELALAMDEMGKAMGTFRAPVAGIAPEQVARVRALDQQVHEELRAERARRCGA